MENDGTKYALALAAEGPDGPVHGELFFGAFVGFLRSTFLDKAKREIHFLWRGREVNHKITTFSGWNTLKITFLDDRTFVGEAMGEFFQACDLAAMRDGPANQGQNFAQNVPFWRDEFNRLDEQNEEWEQQHLPRPRHQSRLR